MLQAFLQTFDITRLDEELQDGHALAAGVAVPLAILSDVKAALIVNVGEVSSALYDVSLEGKEVTRDKEEALAMVELELDNYWGNDQGWLETELVCFMTVGVTLLYLIPLLDRCDEAM